MSGRMTETEREELIEKMVRDIGVACGYSWTKMRYRIVRTHAIVALEVAEPVIREQTESALREENARLREALECIANPDNWGDDGCWLADSYPDEIAEEAIAAAIREGGKDE